MQMTEAQKAELLKIIGNAAEAIAETLRAERDGDTEIDWEGITEDALEA